MFQPRSRGFKYSAPSLLLVFYFRRKHTNLPVLSVVSTNEITGQEAQLLSSGWPVGTVLIALFMWEDPPGNGWHHPLALGPGLYGYRKPAEEQASTNSLCPLCQWHPGEAEGRLCESLVISPRIWTYREQSTIINYLWTIAGFMGQAYEL